MVDDAVQAFEPLRTGKGRIAADIFDHDGNLKKILHHAHTLDSALDGFPRVRQRKQVVGVRTIHTSPAKVVAQPWSIGPANKLFEATKVFRVRRRYRAKVH